MGGRVATAQNSIKVCGAMESWSCCRLSLIDRGQGDRFEWIARRDETHEDVGVDEVAAHSRSS